MTVYEYPEEATHLIQTIAELEGKATAAERRVADQIEHIQLVRDNEHEERMALLEKRLGEVTGQKREVNAEIKRSRASIAKREAALDERVAAFESLRERIGNASELIGNAWAQYESAAAEREAQRLRTKSHPAPAAAKAVQQKGQDLAEAIRRARAAEWVIELYEWNFPWLTELRDIAEADAYVEDAGEEGKSDRDDPVSDWLTKEEFRALEPVERNQRALDRYLKSRKTPWQLGRDYERYIGYLREQAGFAVTYHGIFQGLEDLGRDLLAEKDGSMEIIQCKRWAQHKTIHEKHVFQLYGTMVLGRIEQPQKQISGTFTTTTTLSEKARKVADYLDIKVEEGVPLDDYPRIKCNIGRRADGERIYHLPFDQQYDTTVIEPERDERYVSTTAEAEELGFRRAWRWKGPE